MASKQEKYLIIVDNEVVHEEEMTVVEATRTLIMYRRFTPGHTIILAKEVISEDEL